MLNVIRSAVTSTSHRATYHKLSQSTTSRQTSSTSSQDEPGPNLVANNLSQEVQNKRTLIDRTKVPKVLESDLEEKFISGSGPGGTRVNKSTNCCQIKHKPTGLVVKVHQQRSLEQNRKIARELLAQKLDNLYNGADSVDSQKKRLALHRIAAREAQSEKRRSMKEQYRSRLMNDNTIDRMNE